MPRAPLRYFNDGGRGGGLTEVHISYPKKSQLQNLSTYKQGQWLRGCLPKTGTVAVGLKLHIFSFFCAMKGIHVQVTKWVLVFENNLKSESTQ